MDSLINLFYYVCTAPLEKLFAFVSEVIIILIPFYHSNYHNFYLEYVITYLRNEFPRAGQLLLSLSLQLSST